MSPHDAESILEALASHVRERGSEGAYEFLDASGEVESVLSYAALDEAARTVAGQLASHRVEQQAVILLCPSGPDYVVALLGCLYARAVVVPAYPPSNINLARASERIAAIASDAGARIALCTRQVAAQCAGRDDSFGPLELVTARWPDASAAAPGLRRPSAADLAFLQYTSGSTSAPKGVVLTHAQVVANLEMIQASTRLSSSDTCLSWLPPFHDLGLMGGILAPLFAGCRSLLMAPEAFLRRPRTWLRTASMRRVTTLLTPNFALDLCLRRLRPEDHAGLDLSSIRTICIGAEPINPVTIEAFADAFVPRGFQRAAMYPCYGMAEATLIISGGRSGEPPSIRSYEADELERGEATPVLEVDGSSAMPGRTRRLVSCGRALLDERILIVDPETRATVPACRVGEIWVQSRSVALGYWNRPEETQHTFRAYTSDTNEGPFLRTGDLGFLDAGELFITGRLKDLIIVRGRNHYPQDIERTVQGVNDALVRDAGAAFALESAEGEQLVVVQELDKRLGVDPESLLREIPEAIRRQHEITPASVLLIKRGSLFKTSSGKVKRRAIKEAYVKGDLQIVAGFHMHSPDVSEAAIEPQDLERASQTGSSGVAPTQTFVRPAVAAEERRIAAFLRQLLGTKLGRSPDEIDPNEPLARYGVDSLRAAELVEELERWLGRDLPPTLSYDNPTVTELARALAALTRGEVARRPRPPARSPARVDRDDPIAIVGMACRFPGARDLPAFWTLLRNGVDAITEVPPDRWDVDALYDPRPGTPGKMCSKWGGFVEGIGDFDPAFFGISEREAERIDPQQRMFLEVAWQALEDAGQAPSALAGSATGVFAGVCSSDYALLYGGHLGLVDADYGTGNAPSIVANRLSYLLDLKGPSQTVDSACSSALLALHQACSSLRELECDLAIVGGVNAVLAPEASVYFSQARALALDGRCKSFDSRADGFVRGEGAGVVILKRLSRALADGDRVYALVAGDAVNHDGRSNGLLAPNGKAQQDLLHRAWSNAGVAPDEIDYVEAHGVGTKTADAVELRSLGEVAGERSPQAPLLVGSAKTNVGHLEAASGMVSLIKVTLALHHEEIPPHLHLRDFHPDIGIDTLPIAVPTVPTSWKRGSRPRFAGLSAFGFGGGNAHVVLREAPLPPSAPSTAERPRHLLALSAKDDAALDQLIVRFSHALQRVPDAQLADLAFTANVGRSHFACKLALTASTVTEARDLLQSARERSTDAHIHRNFSKPGATPRVGLIFPHFAVAPVIARGLYDQQPKFRQVLDSCARTLEPELGQSLLEALHEPREDVAALPASVAHAASVALQYALYTLLRDLGVEPGAVYGAGAGEYAAAAAAGCLPWEQALRLATRRGLVLEGLVPGASQRFTPHMLRESLEQVGLRAPSLSFVSASLGRAFDSDAPTVDHFARQLYHEPRSGDGEAAWQEFACDASVVLGPPVEDAGPHGDRALHALASDGDGWMPWLDTLARLYTLGVELDFRELDAPYPRRKLSLPTYPFQRRRYWLDFPPRERESGVPSEVEQPSSHPLITRVRIRRAGAGRGGDGTAQGEG